MKVILDYIPAFNNEPQKDFFYLVEVMNDEDIKSFKFPRTRCQHLVYGYKLAKNKRIHLRHNPTVKEPFDIERLKDFAFFKVGYHILGEFVIYVHEENVDCLIRPRKEGFVIGSPLYDWLVEHDDPRQEQMAYLLGIKRNPMLFVSDNIAYVKLLNGREIGIGTAEEFF